MKARWPELMIDGEMQANVALDEEARAPYPFCKLKGAANVLIFPNLDAGNASYKLLAATGDADVVGPMVMGMKKPVNVLQQGANVDAIVHITAITVARAVRQKSIGTDHGERSMVEPCRFVLESYQRAIRLSCYLVLGFHAATVAAGCVRTDESAAAAGAGWIRLAAGAVHPITIADACPSGGKGNLCSTEKVTSINSVTSSDTRIAEDPPDCGRAERDARAGVMCPTWFEAEAPAGSRCGLSSGHSTTGASARIRLTWSSSQ